ncbi:MAG TPA: energy transducer TonB [Planctomycetota bacterium]|jgi:TonB family protein|nr:energy transducer TonB [Planctomycetota bacterium]
MTTVTEVPKPPVVVDQRKPSVLSTAASRCSGTFVSLLVHGTLVLIAFLSVSAPRMGRGGGVVGRPDGGSGPETYSALLRPEDWVEAERSPDARLYPEAEPDPEDTPEAVAPPAEDFLKEQSETGIPVAQVPPTSTQALPSRSRDAYAKLPPPGGSETDETPTPGIGQKGNSTVNGSGGNTGGAGDGTSNALYMPAPDYPASARRKGIEGVVVVAIDVHPDGHCEHPQLAESSGCDALDDAATSAIRRWKYESRPGDDVIIRRVRFVFKLQR